MKEKIKISGLLTLTLFDQFNNVKEQKTVKNLIMNVGKNFIASRIIQNTPTVMTHMAIGSGSNNPTSATQTQLQTELGRVTFSSSPTNTNNTVQFAATFPAGVGTGTVTEAGILNNITAGTMLCRTVFPAITKLAGDTLTISWIVTIS